MTSVLLAGGGTAGHVNPMLATAAALRRWEPGIELAALGTQTGLEATLVPAAGLELIELPRVALPRSLTPQWFKLPGRMRAAVAVATRAIQQTHADVVVGFGGYVSTPAYVAAHRMGVPIVIHEANSRPGLANRLGARWAARVAVTFPDTPMRRATLTGLPLRPAIAQLDRLAVRPQARAQLGLDPDRPTLLVTGGSQGAARINAAVLGAAGGIVQAGAQVIHLTGRGKADAVHDHLRGTPAAEHYHVLEYLEDMNVAFAAADLAVSRAGASTVCEMSAVGLPAIYVPYPHGNGEQRLNCAHVVAAGGGILQADQKLDAAWVTGHVTPLLVNAGALTSMSQAAQSVGVRDGAERLVALIKEVL